jgi:DNA-binding GntR family transcriptional regulator
MMLLTAMLEHITFETSVGLVRDLSTRETAGRKAHRTRQRLAGLIRAGEADAAEALWQLDLTEGGRELAEHVGSTVVDLLGPAAPHD